MDIKLTPAMLFLWNGLPLDDKDRLLGILLDLSRGHETEMTDMPEEMVIIIEEITKTAIKDTKAESRKEKKHEYYVKAKQAKLAETNHVEISPAVVPYVPSATPTQQPPTVCQVLEMAAQSAAKCRTTEDAELYIASRERTGWKVNGNPIVNYSADIKAFFISKESNERSRKGFDNKTISQDYSGGIL